MAKRNIIVVGASAGGVETLSKLVAGLPADFNAAVFIALHVSAHGKSMMPEILSRAGALPARHPEDGEEIREGRIYVAPPDRHLLVKRGRVRVVRGPRENGHRPAIDPLFRTAAKAYGRRVIGVVLSGMLDDGTAGLRAVKAQGGLAVVQSPADAVYASMPRSAIEHAPVDFVAPVVELPGLLTSLTQEEVEEAMPGDAEQNTEQNRGRNTGEDTGEALSYEADVAEFDVDAVERENKPGVPSSFSCPECGGVLWEIDRELPRFRCRVGHAFTGQSLLAEQTGALETALWTALTALEETAALSTKLHRRALEHGHDASALRFSERARAAQEHARVIRQTLLSETEVVEPQGAEAIKAVSSD